MCTETTVRRVIVGSLLKNLLIYLVIVVFAVLAIKLFANQPPDIKPWTYNTFITSLAGDKIKTVSLKVEDGGYQADGTTADEKFTTHIPNNNPALLKLLDDKATAGITQVTYPSPQPRPGGPGCSPPCCRFC